MKKEDRREKEILTLAVKLEEAITEFQELLGQCIPMDDAIPSFVDMIKLVQTAGKFVLSREQVLMCFMTFVEIELESFIGNLTLVVSELSSKDGDIK